jgi:hypothetical protein
VELAEEKTEEFPKRARVRQSACVNRENSADTGPSRLRKHSWHKRYDRLSIFARRSSLLDYDLIYWSVGFVERCF